jgi:hypothetical protein
MSRFCKKDTGSAFQEQYHKEHTLLRGVSYGRVLSETYLKRVIFIAERLCGLLVRVPAYRSRGPGSISGDTRFSEKWWVCNGVHSASWVQLRSYLKEKVVAPV